MIIRIGSLISLLLLLWSCDPKERWEKQDLHSDHTVFSIHKLAPHVDFFAFESESLAQKNIPESSRNFISLNGSWKFTRMMSTTRFLLFPSRRLRPTRWSQWRYIMLTRDRWRAAVVALEEAGARLSEARRDEVFLRHALEELTTLDPQEGEESDLSSYKEINDLMETVH